ncbi:MAG: NADH-quinone oxidoreductase subunit NuoN [Parerythrobacter sp.]
MGYAASLYSTLPEIILAVAALALVIVSAFGGVRRARLVSILSVAALFGAAAVAGYFLIAPDMATGADAFAGVYRMDAFASFTKLLIYLSAIACLVVTPRFFERTDEYRPEYPVLILLGAVGMGMMVSAIDLMTLYIGLELSSLASYVLASFARKDTRSAEAGLKYFILGALASGILLYGMSLVYGFTGATDYTSIRAAMAGELSTGLLFGVVFVLAGLAFKIAAVPFHMWTPDVYEGAPTPVSLFFATAPKVAAIAMLMRMALDPFGLQVDAWRQIVIFSALASIVVGALGAIGQTSLKRLLAYSSINNIGFILIGLATATQVGAGAMLVYLFFYLAMTLGSFLVVMMLRDRNGTQLEALSDISGLSQTHRGLALCLMLMMFSLAGIPPMTGFWGKFVVFQAAVEADLVLLAAIGIAASVIGAFYYLKVIKMMYFDDPARGTVVSAARADWVVLVLATSVVSPLGFLLTSWLGDWTDRAAAALFFTI